MKKFLSILFTVSLLLGIYVFSEHEHVHIHALQGGDPYGVCPNCSQPMTIDFVISDPTCETDGAVSTSCFSCGAVESYVQSVPKLGHDYQKSSAAGTPATCTSGGTDFYVCTRCGSSYSQDTAALGHSYTSQITQQATCTAVGVKTNRCTRCGNTYTETIAALGHDYTSKVTKAATCTAAGVRTYSCTRCGNAYTESLKALGHDYTSVTDPEATCTRDGLKTFTCSRCKDSYTEILPAFGHDIDYEIVEATCTKEGYRYGECKTCGEKTVAYFPALGHKPGTFTIVKKATCTEDGSEEAVCETCGETIAHVLPKSGHHYPEEWTVETEAGYFHEGLETKTCMDCEEKISQTIPKKNVVPVVLAGGGVLAAAGGGVFLSLRKNASGTAEVAAAAVSAGIAEKAAEEATELGKPSFESKSVLYAAKDEKLLELLKKQRHLEVASCEYEDLEEAVEENEPDLLIVGTLSEEALEDILAKKEEALKDTAVGLLIEADLLETEKEKLDGSREEKKIVDYAEYGKDAYDALVRLVLPVLKPKLNSDESLENIGMVADALGIPGVSTLINVYVSGRDIKNTLAEGELGVSGTAAIIGDIASILGLDTVASVAGLVDDVDTIKAAFDKEAGTYEEAEGVSSAKDMVDVVSDLIDKI